ncbi:flagellar hook-length control protein FliK [Pseudomonas sp. GD03944]|uniref:flagellar hook-length control protein FliK n=1 Tax=Pseudomonas sp. GD03944 TaxID=2975409 RepID=UPI00244899A6|nr:flagellar hook-length control protein FliK [Pseudomonas sp. GD03944]MDH1261736.1 flagellar hook-length control protein FliK [Pseudomonas sp. GD03944]
MSVAPDLLLKPAPEMKPKTSAAKAPDRSAEPRKNEASSFAQVYAKERQAKAAERNDASAKHSRETRPEPAANAPTPPADAAAQPAVADSGKPLPSDTTDEEGVVDPLLLFGITGQPPTDVVEGTGLLPEGEAEGDLVQVPAGSLVGSGPASMTEASFDPELDALNQMPAVQMALEMGKAKAASAEQGTPGTASGQTLLSTGQSFASAMAAMGVQQAETETEPALDLSTLEVTTEVLETMKESVADNRPENFVSKLSALSQAIGQQTNAATRPMVGQPVAMQQAGWSEAVVDRVMLMSSQNLKSAEIQLDPAELGRLEVRINMSQDQAQVTFASANAGVREALESQMHRLRDMFTQQGMNLADVNVSDQSNRGWQGQEGNGRGQGGRSNELLGSHEDDALHPVAEVRSTPLSGGRGMVDFYA